MKAKCSHLSFHLIQRTLKKHKRKLAFKKTGKETGAVVFQHSLTLLPVSASIVSPITLYCDVYFSIYQIESWLWTGTAGSVRSASKQMTNKCLVRE